MQAVVAFGHVEATDALGWCAWRRMRRERVAVKAMFVREAIEQPADDDCSSVVFQNLASDRVSIVHTRKDDLHAVVEPEVR